MSHNEIQLDLSDPNNPIAKVREAHVAFTAVYKGEDAWNQNELVAKLEDAMRLKGWSVRTFNLDKAYDAEGNLITEDDMREYVFRKHGHSPGSRCPSCPDPVKWKEVEKLRLKAYYEDLEKMKDGRPAIYTTPDGEPIKKKIYVLETQEEREKRLRELLPKPEQPRSAIKGKDKEEKKLKGWEHKIQHGNETKTKKYEPDFDVEPKLQFTAT